MSEYEVHLMNVYSDAFALGGVIGCFLCLVLGMQFVKLVW